MENTVPNTNIPYDPLYDDLDLLFNSYYDPLYSDSDLLFNSYYDFLYNTSDPTFEYNFLYNHEIHNETQIENERINVVTHPENENICRYDEDGNHQEEEYNDDSEHEKEENKLELNQGMEFETWELAETYLDNYAKQQEFCFRKRRRIPDPLDNTITRHRTYECSYARIHEVQKVILAENRRDRDSEMIGCPWHINIAFPKSINGVRINNIVGEHNHDMNPLITEIAPKFRKLTDKMLENIKFWII
jgi:hypothetical protein